MTGSGEDVRRWITRERSPSEDAIHMFLSEERREEVDVVVGGSVLTMVGEAKRGE